MACKITYMITTVVIVILLLDVVSNQTRESCVDSVQGCEAMKRFGACVKRKQLMKKTCGKTCNLCAAVDKKETKSSTNDVTINQSKCEDSSSHCDFMKERGYCIHRAKAMEKLCRKSCGICASVNATIVYTDINRMPMQPIFASPIQTRKTSEVCRDTRDSCPKFKSYGWCESKKRAMTKYCPKTCNLCQLKYVVVVKTTRKTPVTQASSDSQCFDKRKDCISLEKRFGWCTSRKSTMMKLCKESCGFCTKAKSFTVIWKATTKSPSQEAKKVCRDTIDQCLILKKRGFCQRNKETMKEKCPKTCSMCDKPNKEEKPKATTYQASHCTNTWPHARCAYYSHLGWCSKHGEIQEKCRKTCVCDRAERKQKNKPDCSTDKNNPKCKVVCRDDPRFQVLCGRFGNDCNGNGGLAKSLKRYCPKTCRLCT